MQKDPVCGMSVDEKKAKFMSTFEEKNVYFCSAMCKTSYDNDPRKYKH